jgi:hypothetical protein
MGLQFYLKKKTKLNKSETKLNDFNYLNALDGNRVMVVVEK